MTVIQPNSISGITSITAQSDSIQFYKSDGILAGLNLDGVNFNTTSGVSTFSNVVITGGSISGVSTIGVTTVTATNLTVNGDTRITGILTVSGAYAATTAAGANLNVAASGQIRRFTSSIKYKTNVETIEDSYSDALLNCRPVWYRSLSEGDNPSWGFWGFIAEEVAEIDKRLVSWNTQKEVIDENGNITYVDLPLEEHEPEGVHYTAFIPHLLNIIKRMKVEINDLKIRISQLEQP